MSSTGRGGVRHPHDYYRTPSWAVYRLLERLELPGGSWCDPAAGDGALIRAVNTFRAERKQPAVAWHAYEIQEDKRNALNKLYAIPRITNFLTDPCVVPWSVLFVNPPFASAQEFVIKALDVAQYAVFLLRLNFAASAERQEFMAKRPPDIYVLPNRISFTGDGRVDSCDYAWFVWESRRRRKCGRFQVLAKTSLDERRAA